MHWIFSPRMDRYFLFLFIFCCSALSWRVCKILAACVYRRSDTFPFFAKKILEQLQQLLFLLAKFEDLTLCKNRNLQNSIKWSNRLCICHPSNPDNHTLTRGTHVSSPSTPPYASPSPPLLLSPFPISDPLPPRCRPRPLPPRRPQALPSTAVSAQLTVVPRPALASAVARRAPAGASNVAVGLHGRRRQPRLTTMPSMTGMGACDLRSWPGARGRPTCPVAVDFPPVRCLCVAVGRHSRPVFAWLAAGGPCGGGARRWFPPTLDATTTSSKRHEHTTLVARVQRDVCRRSSWRAQEEEVCGTKGIASGRGSRKVPSGGALIASKIADRCFSESVGRASFASFFIFYWPKTGYRGCWSFS
jgi:hypothetical protein